jgi:integrase
MASVRADLKPTTKAAYCEALAPTTEATATRHGRLADLRIDIVFGGYPLNAVRREQIADWVQRMINAGKKPSTVRNAYFLVRMVLAQAVADGRLPSNPSDYIKLPTEHNTGTGAGVVDDTAEFLTAAQVSALVAATPWPYCVMVHVAAWAGLRAAELAGLQVGDVAMPAKLLNPNAASRPGVLTIERSVARLGGELTYITPKTKGSRRRVPLTATTTALLRDYLMRHPRADEPTAPLFPGMLLGAFRPTGIKTTENKDNGSIGSRAVASRQATALADLSVAEAEARLVLDWASPIRHMTFYKSVYRPAVLRTNRLTPTEALSPALKFHSLRHTYASLCVAAGIPPMELSRFMGHSKVATTLGIYTHLFNTDDHADAMAALGAIDQPAAYGENVIPVRV